MTLRSLTAPERCDTLVDILRLRAERQADELLFRFLEEGEVDGPIEAWTYRTLDTKARAVATALREAGATGQRVILLYAPGLEFVAGFMGCLYAGAVAVPSYPPDPTRLERTLPRLQAIVADSGAKTVLTNSMILEMSGFLLPQAPELGAMTWIASDATTPAQAEAFQPVPLRGDGLAFLQYTSGSTGTPKGVMISHANILHNEALISRAFGVSDGASGVGWLPMFHDMGLIGKVLQPIYAGIPCTLMSPIHFLQRPLRWLEAISRFKGTVSGGPNFAYDLCVRKVTEAQLATLDLSSWMLAFNGAEPVRRETLDRFAATFGPCGFKREAYYPCYGLAEGTLIATGGEVGKSFFARGYDLAALGQGRALERDPAAEGACTLISSGRAAPDQQVRVVNAETRVPCPTGEIGEIWLSGPSVAGGYWNRPELSEHAFQARLASGEGPYLRTGDLGFLDGDGELFIAGRLKDLLIIRGRNVYPQDVEHAAEHAHPALRPGCSAAFGVEVDGEERLALAAEVDLRAGVEPAAVVEAVRRAIAEEHGLHAHAVLLLVARSIPKTSSGKIQRHATRAAYLANELEVVERSEVREAATETTATSAEAASLPPLKEALATAAVDDRPALIERQLRAEVARLLHTDPARLDRDAPLASLGLDSLTVVDLHGRLEASLGVSLPSAFLWQHPTLAAATAQLLEAWQGIRPASALAAPPITAASLDGALPLSSGQQRLWFLDRLVPGSALYNLHFQLRLSGPLDEAALAASLETLLRRHAVLRASFPEEAGQPRQLIAPPGPVALPRIDLRAVPAAERTAALDAAALEHARAPFDLATGPLVRAALVQLDATEHALLMTQHHIVTDGWSIGVLARELATLYRAAARKAGDPLPPPRLHYADFARWQRGLGSLLDGQRAYWTQALAGLPRLELPTDHARPREAAYVGATHPFTLPRSVVDALQALGRREGCTLFVTLAAGFTALLQRYSGQDDFAIGTIAASRDRAELRDVIGFFANTLVLRADLSGDPTFRALLARTRTAVTGALSHSDLPFEEVVAATRASRSGGDQNPLFQVSLVLESLPPADMSIPGMAWRPALPTPDGAVPGTAKFDLGLALAEGPDGLTGAIEYRSDLFDAETIARLAGHLEVLLRAAADAPDRPVSALPVLTGAEERTLLADWSPRPAAPGLPTLDAQLAAQARLRPDAIAVVYEAQSITYAELDRRAGAVAAKLRALGVGPEARVALCAERSIEMVVGLVAVLKAGGAYVPLDPGYPRERLAYMLEDSGAKVLLTQPHLAGTLPDLGRAIVHLDAAPVPDVTALPASGVGPDSPAYVIYTSGSTGKPKGVVVPHGTVARFFAAMDERLDLGDTPGAWLALTSISFDISVLELLWTLARGFKVVVQAEEGITARPAANARTAAARARKLDFSLFYFADDSEQSGDRYRLLLDGARFADTHGFAAVWTPERHFHAFGGLYPNPAVTSAAVAAITQRVQIRAGSVVLPLHHPVRVAEDWALVDNLSRGRVGISIASGWHANDFVFAPERYAGRRQGMLDGLEVVRKLWRGESVSFPGGTGQPVDVRIRPTPVQRELPVWLTAAGNPETFEAAGRLGTNVLTHLLGQSWEDLESKIGVYRKAWKAAGHAGEGHVTLMLHTFLDRDPAKVRATIDGPFRQYLKSSLDLMRGLGKTLGVDIDSAAFTPQDLDRLVTHAFDRYVETSGLFGTPAEALEKIDRLKALGVDEVGCLIDFGIAADTVLASLPLLDEVRQQSERDQSRGADHARIPAQLRDHAITHVQCTPSLARALLLDPEAQGALGGLRKLLLGGEALPAALADPLEKQLGPGRLINMYGPTETTIWSSTHRVDGASETPVVSIGTPIPGTQLHVLDRHFAPLPVGVPGELFIAGEGVVRGYLHRPDLTADRFVPDPFHPVGGARMYRTGDRARWRADGTVEFLGRVDHQLKVRGFRIEAGEIEAALAQLPPVRETVVVAREDDPGDVRLVAYVVAREGHPFDAAALRQALQARLPDYMVPSLVVELSALPLTPNGKVDRKALPAPTATRAAKVAFVAPQGQLEQQIAEIWRTVLKVDAVGVNDNFFDLGGHSLLMVQVHAQLRGVVPRELPLLKLLEHPTVGALARWLRQDDGAPASFEAAQDRAKRQLDHLKKQRQRLQTKKQE